MTRRATLALVKSEPDPEPQLRVMRALPSFVAEAHNIANVAAALARKVDRQTTDQAIADARQQATTLAARLLKLAKAPA